MCHGRPSTRPVISHFLAGARLIGGQILCRLSMHVHRAISEIRFNIRMLKKFIAVSLAVSLLSACTNSSTTEMPTPKELSDALPAVTDMPEGWKESQRQVFEVREAENPSIDPSIWCAEAQDESSGLVELAGDSGADVEMQTESDSGMPRMMRLQAWANDDAEEYFDGVQASVAACDGTKVTDEFGVITETNTIEGRSIGDESISWLQKTVPPIETQEEKLESIGRTTVARFGSTIMVLQLGDVAMAGTTIAMDEDQWWAIVEIAAKDLKNL